MGRTEMMTAIASDSEQLLIAHVHNGLHRGTNSDTSSYYHSMNGSHYDYRSSSTSIDKPHRRLIEVVNDDQDRDHAPVVGKSALVQSHALNRNDDYHDDKDEDPPPIFSNEGNGNYSQVIALEENPNNEHYPSHQVPTNTTEISSNTSSYIQKLSLAEQMLNQANQALDCQRQEKNLQQEMRVKQTSFGLKKGFLNSSRSSTKCRFSKNSKGWTQNGQQDVHSTLQYNRDYKGDASTLIEEYDNDGKIVPLKAETVTNQGSNNPFILSDVQNAMTSHLQKFASEWATPDLIQSIANNHPKLAQGLHDPTFTAALHSMQRNPKETIERLQRDHPKLLEFLEEFCAILGDHFMKLGQQKEHQDESHSQRMNVTDGVTPKVKEMGPIEKKALLRHYALNKADSKCRLNSHVTEVNETDEKVSAILNNEELRSILLDPEMQEIMEHCSSDRGRFYHYINHREYGPKLQKMIQAGLLQIV